MYETNIVKELSIKLTISWQAFGQNILERSLCAAGQLKKEEGKYSTWSRIVSYLPVKAGNSNEGKEAAHWNKRTTVMSVVQKGIEIAINF